MVNEGTSPGSGGTDAARAIEWTQLVIRAMEFSPEPLTKVTYLMNALLSQIRADAGFISLTKYEKGTGNIAIIRAFEIGMWGNKERSSRQSYERNTVMYPDPFVIEYVRKNNMEGPLVRRREDCVGDEAWYESDHYKVHRIAANQDACMYTTIPARDSFGNLIEENTIWTACACRATGDLMFTEAERDWFGQCFFGLEKLLFEALKTPEAPTEIELSKLPLRMRRVAGCLINGDSEKQAAIKLGLSAHTIHGYVKELYKAMDVQSRPELLVKLLSKSST